MLTNDTRICYRLTTGIIAECTWRMRHIAAYPCAMYVIKAWLIKGEFSVVMVLRGSATDGCFPPIAIVAVRPSARPAICHGRGKRVIAPNP